MSDLITRLRQLEADEEVTPAPWPLGHWPSLAELELVVAARNALPQLLAIAEAVPAILAMLDAYTLVLRQLPYEHRGRVRLRDMQRDLRDALAALDSQETE